MRSSLIPLLTSTGIAASIIAGGPEVCLCVQLTILQTTIKHFRDESRFTIPGIGLGCHRERGNKAEARQALFQRVELVEVEQVFARPGPIEVRGFALNAAFGHVVELGPERGHARTASYTDDVGVVLLAEHEDAIGAFDL